MKFGGTSVGKPERMRMVSKLIQDDEAKFVVLSALSGTTNRLVAICEHIREPNIPEALVEITSLKKHHQAFIDDLFPDAPAPSNRDFSFIEESFTLLEAIAQAGQFLDKDEKVILAQGELLSTQIFQQYLLNLGHEVVLLPALDFMRINAEEEPDLAAIRSSLSSLMEQYPDKQLFMTQGYICRNPSGDVDNLKRGGSDYTASLLGAVLQAREIQIWTDIDGMHNSDPRIVKDTSPVERLSFDEAAELAYFGAKILHPATIYPAQQFGIPVKLLNTMEPNSPGTLIQDSPDSPGGIKSIAAKDGITAIKIKSSRMLLAYGFLRKIFDIFERYKTPIDMITTSEVAVSLTVDKDDDLDHILEELRSFGTVEVDKNQTIICVVGDFVSEHPGTAARIFTSLDNIPVRMISFGGSRHNISLLVATEHKDKALVRIKEGLF